MSVFCYQTKNSQACWKYINAIVVSVLLVFTILPVLANDVPPFEMHFFADEELELTLSNNSNHDSLPDMQMVIFTPDEELADETISYVDDNDDFSFVYSLDTGYRQHSVNWSVASPTGRPNTLTEIKWKDLSLLGFDIGFNLTSANNLVFKGNAGYAWTVAGDSRQIFYLQDGKNRPFSDVKNDSGNGYAWQTSLALGYALDFGSAYNDSLSFNVTPLVGYAWREQNLKADQGKEQLSTFNFTAPETLKLENSYSASWYGPWLGADFTISAFNNHQLFSSFQHHWANYKAEGHWRQAQDLQQPKSFVHRTDATGLVASAGYRYLTDAQWGVSVSIDYQNWESESGREKLFTVNNDEFSSRFNGVEWEAFGINVGVNMKF